MVLHEKKKEDNVTIYYVGKDFEDSVIESIENTFVDPSCINLHIEEDADVYAVDENTGHPQLLLKFRKKVLTKENIDSFSENINKVARKKTTNRGGASGSKRRDVESNKGIMTNIIGYFDKWSIGQSHKFKRSGKKPSVEVREAWFNYTYPDEYAKTLPLIKEIDTLYKKLVPEHYKKQMAKAKQTHFRIPGTSFTTITTNVNFQTSIHCDKGDDPQGFGNLAVIERGGKYLGGETCFPQYGIAVNVREGDILFMDVHEPHGNLKIIPLAPDAERLSIVCYLREHVWKRTSGKSAAFYERHTRTVRKLLTEPIRRKGKTLKKRADQGK